MLRLIQEDRSREDAAGLGGRSRIVADAASSRSVTSVQQLAAQHEYSMGIRQLAAPHPEMKRVMKRDRVAAKLPRHRLPTVDRAEASRQVHNQQVHDWLKKHSRKAVPRSELSRKKRALLRSCFSQLDADGSGTIEQDELGLAMRSLGFDPEDVKLAFECCDTSSDGKLDFEEFVQLFTVAWAHRETRVAFNDAFARDLSDVVADACSPVGKGAPQYDEAQTGEAHVTTAFPFVLVANSHRITQLVEACNPLLREIPGEPKADSERRRAQYYAEQRASAKTARAKPATHAATRFPPIGRR